MSELSVSAPRRRTEHAVHLRRRLVALVLLVVLVTLAATALGRIGAQAELADPVAGHVVMAPGDTLWEIAVSSAPAGIDPRAQLEAIRELNGFDAGAHVPWTVVLLPSW